MHVHIIPLFSATVLRVDYGELIRSTNHTHVYACMFVLYITSSVVCIYPSIIKRVPLLNNLSPGGVLHKGNKCQSPSQLR